MPRKAFSQKPLVKSQLFLVPIIWGQLLDNLRITSGTNQGLTHNLIKSKKRLVTNWGVGTHFVQCLYHYLFATIFTYLTGVFCYFYTQSTGPITITTTLYT